MFQQTIVTGRLTKDLELQTRGSGERAFEVTDGSIAYRTRRKNKDGDYITGYIDFSATNGTAKSMAKFLKKGSTAQLIGEFEKQEWEDKNGGGKRSRWILNVDRAIFLDSAASSHAAAANNNANNQARFTPNNGQQAQGGFANTQGFNQGGLDQTQGAFGGNTGGLGAPDFSRDAGFAQNGQSNGFF